MLNNEVNSSSVRLYSEFNILQQLQKIPLGALHAFVGHAMIYSLRFPTKRCAKQAEVPQRATKIRSVLILYLLMLTENSLCVLRDFVGNTMI
jgi:hypothetical protein